MNLLIFPLHLVLVIVPTVYVVGFMMAYPPEKTFRYWMSFLGYGGWLISLGMAIMWYVAIASIFGGIQAMFMWEELIIQFTDLGAEFRIWLLLIPAISWVFATSVTAWAMRYMVTEIATGLAIKHALTPKR